MFEVKLTVTDNEGLTGTAELVISLNNTPPSVNIISPVDSSYYPMESSTVYDLIANVSDAEHSNEELEYSWRTTLHHNDHTHPEPADYNDTTTAVISPVGCDGELYRYEILLTVTDNAGLSNSDTVNLFPDCPVKANDDFANFSVGGITEIDVLANDIGNFDISTLRIKEEAFHGITAVDTNTGIITYTHDSTATIEDYFSYLIDEVGGASLNTATVHLSQYGPPTIIIDLPLDNEEFGDKDVIINYTLSGDLNSFDHVHFVLDSPPHVAVHHLSPSPAFAQSRGP